MISPEWSEVSATSAVPASHSSSSGSSYVSSTMAGELALVEEGLLARHRRDGDRGETGFGDLLQRPAHQLGLEQRQPALEAILPRSRHLHDPRQVRPVVLLDQRDMVERLEIELRDLAFLPDDGVEALVGADRRAVPRNVGDAHQQRLERVFLLAELGLQLARLGARFLGPPPKLGAFLGRSALEAGADRVALGPKRLDLGLEPAHVAVERQQFVEVQRRRPWPRSPSRPPRVLP